MNKIKKLILKVWQNPVFKCACLTAVVVAGTMIVDSARNSLGSTISVTVSTKSNTPT